ncbi:lipoprotein [Nocardiopsis terrae]|uniref:DUF4097 domain-containing protein n=1 Tax=Nocardiopsis terrae TaxID=372655 RepID=A0ABR9HIF8_9ACTN|nr:DUF4097 family beta strand repeat-containing protein [Nocardiopsis terrae]MBE1458726.1 hypothetical protein [Nocardiopsis terrae]GHC78840.1 lipoprotein [Nocardiopsis terrae]
MAGSQEPTSRTVREEVRHRLLAAGSVLLTLSLLAGCGQDSGSGEPGDPEEKSYEGVPELLIVENDNAALEIVPGGTDEVRVQREAQGNPNGDWELTGDTLRLETDCAAFSDCRIRYQVIVPADTALTVATDEGPVTVSGFSAPVEISSGNGGLDISDVTGPLTLTSVNGDMNLTGIGSESLSAATDNGGIDAAFAEAPSEVEVSTNNGDATIALPGGPYAVFETSDNGRVVADVPVDEASDNTVTARTGNGTITLVPAG